MSRSSEFLSLCRLASCIVLIRAFCGPFSHCTSVRISLRCCLSWFVPTCSAGNVTTITVCRALGALPAKMTIYSAGGRTTAELLQHADQHSGRRHICQPFYITMSDRWIGFLVLNISFDLPHINHIFGLLSYT